MLYIYWDHEMYSTEGQQVMEIENLCGVGAWRSRLVGWIKRQVLTWKWEQFRQASKNVSANRWSAASQLKKTRDVGFE